MPALADELRDSRARLLELVLDLDDAQWMGPLLPIVNPIRWEIAHVAWFQEKWVLRHARNEEPQRQDGDSLYDSSAIPHDTRWNLPLPSRAETLAYMQRILDRTLACVPERRDKSAYFHELALFHEDMHAEAITYTRHTLEYRAPRLALAQQAIDPRVGGGPLPGDVDVPGGSFMLGAPLDEPFVFDNEKWAHPVEVAPFRIARACTTNADFAAFVDDRGYERRELWSDDGWAWRASGDGATHPVYWTRGARGEWIERRFDATAPLAPHKAVSHVCWFEAEAYCKWARRRLPTEIEWELAASGVEKRRFPWGDAPPMPHRANLDGRALGTVDVGAFPDGDSVFGCRQMIGNVWEWTASDFKPFPGFIADPYNDYSEPWFASPHKVLRGGCWATRGRLLRNTWRNFYPPHRRDVFGGFRTCAL
jgi:iron(II)-dependent oxidoreductase